jgi:hypothetical protein
MSGPQLTAVARVLNESLPPSLRINVEPDYPPGKIRVEIETVVGLRSAPHPVPSVQPLSQSHSEEPVPYHCLVDGDPLLKDMNYDGDVGMAPPLSPKCRLIAPTSAARTICEPAPRASPSPVVQWSCPARSISDTDVDTLHRS